MLVDLAAEYAEYAEYAGSPRSRRLRRKLRTVSMPIARGKQTSHSSGEVTIGSSGSAESCSKFIALPPDFDGSAEMPDEPANSILRALNAVTKFSKAVLDM